MSLWRRSLSRFVHSSSKTSEPSPTANMAKTRAQTKQDSKDKARNPPRSSRKRIMKTPVKATARVRKAPKAATRTQSIGSKQAPLPKQLTNLQATKLDKAKANFKDNILPFIAQTSGPRDCATCGEHRPVTSFRIRTPTSKCKHPSSTCRSCLSRWMSTQLEGGQFDQVVCPECPQLLQKCDIVAHGTKASRTRYEYLANLNYLSKQKGFTRCLNQDCDSGQVHGYYKGKKLKPQDPHFKCRTCKHEYCVNCKTDWHRSKLCIEMFAATPEEKKRQEVESQKTVETIAKKCPNKICGRPIEKRSGCNHMRCKSTNAFDVNGLILTHKGSICGTNFCWPCLATYGRGIPRCACVAGKFDECAQQRLHLLRHWQLKMGQPKAFARRRPSGRDWHQ